MASLAGDVRVGELARVTGLTVRTWHYYDDIGLLCPSARNGAGHRLYAADEVDRLYRIILLRRLRVRGRPGGPRRRRRRAARGGDGRRRRHLAAPRLARVPDAVPVGRGGSTPRACR
ncbi:hypothetical protein Acsp06_63510 [Actinomycetospora sp. NBRC 106375]|uniref:MerR family transcriptional regulator n=1 Tax=Actinomycetospora sp. NBRC 106375 TaxID=3032207 RepID=UPI0024A1C514|nr:MerR family transcriptional regulator [Actinomycetospora sp. NBRC 106375]GLZ50166.1 hypothetical protein Acsp06_63510 [Actinomycetospora sp. NBRC 106375]